MAALLEGRDFIGVEKTEHYASIADDRLTDTIRQILGQDNVVLTA